MHFSVAYAFLPLPLVFLGGVTALLLAVAPGPLQADGRPVYVIPHRSGAPIIINGVDASGAIVEGDWGLHRPGAGSVTVVPGRIRLPPLSGGYFPATGVEPGYGRHEVEPPAPRRPPPAQRYRREWSTEDRSPAVAPFYLPGPAADDHAAEPPPVIEAMPARRRARSPRRSRLEPR